MEIIQTPQMPKSAGHYSHCIHHNGILYLAGQLPRHPVTGEIPKSIEEQALQALLNVETILKEAGSSKNDVLQARVYVTNISLWDKVNEVYSKFFGDHKPARSIVPVRDLHFGCLIEIEVVAVKPGK